MLHVYPELSSVSWGIYTPVWRTQVYRIDFRCLCYIFKTELSGPIPAFLYYNLLFSCLSPLTHPSIYPSTIKHTHHVVGIASYRCIALYIPPIYLGFCPCSLHGKPSLLTSVKVLILQELIQTLAFPDYPWSGLWIPITHTWCLLYVIFLYLYD